MQQEGLNPRIGKRQYLVTYSKADSNKFPTRESFAKAIVDCFNSGGGKIKVTQWACAKENHQREGFHYHCAMKFNGVKKWIGVKRAFEAKHGVVLHFSDTHNHYVTAYRYICKEDNGVAHSPGHPDLTAIGSPRTKACTAAYRQKRRKLGATASSTESDTPQPPRPVRKRLSNCDVSEFITLRFE